jgi:hypothetical protein
LYVQKKEQNEENINRTDERRGEDARSARAERSRRGPSDYLYRAEGEEGAKCPWGAALKFLNLGEKLRRLNERRSGRDGDEEKKKKQMSSRTI